MCRGPAHLARIKDGSIHDLLPSSSSFTQSLNQNRPHPSVTTSKSIFVFTVTGDQGRSVALILKQAGWEVTGLTRSTDSPSAKGESPLTSDLDECVETHLLPALAQQGIKLVQGDLNHPESFTKHLAGARAQAAHQLRRRFARL